MKILIVEDEEMLRDVLQMAFSRSKNSEFFFAETTSKAIDILKKNTDIDFVTLDGNLADGDKGEEVARYITEKMWAGQRETKRPAMVEIAGDPSYIQEAAKTYPKPFRVVELALNPDAWIKKMMALSDQKNGSAPCEPDVQSLSVRGGHVAFAASSCG